MPAAELRRYVDTFLRRWWLVAAITLATGLLSFLSSPLSQPSHVSTLRVVLGVQPEPPRGAYFTYDRYYTMLSTEFIADDFIEVARSRAFHDAVVGEMNPPPSTGITVGAQPRLERAPRIVSVTVAAPGEDDARRGGEAAARVVTNRFTEFFPQFAPGAAVARVIDPPQTAPRGAAGRDYLNIGLRALVGLVAGLGLAFFLHYLDTTLYDAVDVERHIGLPVLAEIPRGDGR